MTATDTPSETPNPARRVVANISLSLDGRIRGPEGEHDMGWIVPHAVTDVARDHMVATHLPATTALLGRKNYQGFSSYWPTVADDADADPRDRRFAAWLNGVEKVVFSTTLTGATWENTIVTDEAPATLVKDLRQHRGGDIVVLSSTSIIRALLAADAVDRLSINLCPRTVGSGPRLFDDGMAPNGDWGLVESKPTGSGALVLVYDRTR